MIASAGTDVVSTLEGVPGWLKLIALVVGTPVAGVLVAYLRKLLRVEEPTAPPRGEAPPTTQQGAPAVTQTQPAPPPGPPAPPPDPEIALIATMVERLHAELETTRVQITEANRVHSQEMAAAEERHRRSMADVMDRLADREETIVQLRATIDVLTGRRPPQP